MNKRLRTVLITWVVVYPIITVLLGIVGPWINDWPIPLRTLLLTLLMVPLMVLWAMPFAKSKFSSFLNPNNQSGSQSIGVRIKINTSND